MSRFVVLHHSGVPMYFNTDFIVAIVPEKLVSKGERQSEKTAVYMVGDADHYNVDETVEEVMELIGAETTGLVMK